MAKEAADDGNKTSSTTTEGVMQLMYSPWKATRSV